MQLKKLAIICNLCFWLSLIFQFWKSARALNEHLLNTILILGIVAIFTNGLWLVISFKNFRVKSRQVNFTDINLLSIFIIISFVAQLAVLALKYL